MGKVFFAICVLVLPIVAHAQSANNSASDRDGAKAFVDKFWSEWASPNNVALPYIQSVTGDPLNFFGKSISRAKFMKSEDALAKRWPLRDISVLPGSEDVLCDNKGQICNVSGNFTFSYYAPDRYASSQGKASYAFLLRETRVNSTLAYQLVGIEGATKDRNTFSAHLIWSGAP